MFGDICARFYPLKGGWRNVGTGLSRLTAFENKRIVCALVRDARGASGMLGIAWPDFHVLRKNLFWFVHDQGGYQKRDHASRIRHQECDHATRIRHPIRSAIKRPVPVIWTTTVRDPNRRRNAFWRPVLSAETRPREIRIHWSGMCDDVQRLWLHYVKVRLARLEHDQDFEALGLRMPV